MVRYIHSGDQVEADKKHGKPEQQKPPQHEGQAAQQSVADGGQRQDEGLAAQRDGADKGQPQGEAQAAQQNGADRTTPQQEGQAVHQADAGGGQPQETEVSGELGAVTRPIEGGAEIRSGMDAGPGAEGRPSEAEPAGSIAAEGREAGDAADSAAAGSTAADSLETGGAADNEASGSTSKDSSAAGDDSDSQESGGGVKGFLSSLFGDDAGPGQGAGADSGDGQNQDAEAADELGQPQGDSASAGQGDKAASGAESGEDIGAESGADIGVDSGATGYGDHDLQASDGAGTPDQEGPAKPDQGTPDTEKITAQGASGGDEDKQEAEGPAADDGAGTASASGEDNPPAPASGSQSQDTETSDELGAETPQKSHKGFFARLFGDDEEPEEDEQNASGADKGEEGPSRQAQSGGASSNDTDKSGAPQKAGDQSGNKAKKAKSSQGADSAGKPKDLLQQKRDNERSDSLEESIKYWQGNDKVSTNLEDTKKTLTEVMGLGSSFDIVFREMSFGGRRVALLCISGFAKDTIIDEILKRLTYLTPDNISTDVFASFMSEYIPHVQVEKGELLSESINKVLSGMSVFFIEGESQVIIMDTRSYPSRSPDEPSIERVVRGARDGFTETLLSNVALVRRRIRDPGLKYEMHQIGRRTRTDVCVAYIDDIVDKTQVQAVTDKLKSVDIDGIPLADKQLEEAIVGGGWNPYPLVRYSERPDIVASHLLEGRVVVFVDTSPSVMVLPTTFFDLCQHAEENRQTPFMGSYLRWVRFIGIFASMFLLPLWMLLVLHPELKPAMLEFIGPQKTAKIPLIAQFLIVELGVDLLRMAAVHTPTPLGSAMGLIAAILVGDIAVQTGLFVNEVVLYMAVASIGMFATPSYELGLANRIVRLALLLAVAAFQIPGFMIGTTLLVVLLTTHRSYNSSYLWPFIPFNAKAMGEILLRQPVLSSKTRPSFNKTRDNTRMPPKQEKEHKS
ncbi:spore germination protein [Paenibacillus sp. FSL R10-2199]|uniref:spore germination protein n=1 Tax=Paenibacillus sp. FSL R10-2199 TaxID=2975348 RepID=UPI0030FC3B28